MTDLATHLAEAIAGRTARVGFVGLGYVGLPLAAGFAEAGFRVLGVDLSVEKVNRLNRGESYISDVPTEVLGPLVRAGRLAATTDYGALVECDAIFICVPTPFTPSKAPDLSYVLAAARGVAGQLRRGQLVLLESTTYPGTTEEDVLPILAETGLRPGGDFFLAFSPERIVPGDREHGVANTPKVVGGLTPTCTKLAAALLGSITQVHPVSNPRAAEMAKLLENTFRSVNIALVNELAKLCERMGIDIWEVIEAAKTKPFGFMPFYPGAGVGGHCIQVDPYYLSWKARQYDFFTKFIEHAADVNESMPYHVAGRVAEGLNSQGKSVRGARVLVLGVAFKRDVDDARNSPAERLIELLISGGATVRYHDPYIPTFQLGSTILHQALELSSVPLTAEEIASADCVVIPTGHTCIDYRFVSAHAALIVDACNATGGAGDAPVVRVGAPFRASEQWVVSSVQ